ncbi:MAG: transposase [Phycisphaerales bacterium]|nr:transposase [Phycisphaerales bacterium]
MLPTLSLPRIDHDKEVDVPNYRRAHVPGGTFFLTIVTRHRRPVLTHSPNLHALGNALRETQRDHPFECNAIVLLPDHWHVVMTLPSGDEDFSGRIHAIKRRTIFESGDRALWQRGFMEHTVRNERSFSRIVEYILFNPVRHGVARCPHIWPHSSFHKFVRDGIYANDWGCSCDGRRVTVRRHDAIAALAGE